MIVLKNVKDQEEQGLCVFLASNKEDDYWR